MPHLPEYGSREYLTVTNHMKWPGMSMGSQGRGKAVYFFDPDGHVRS